MVSNKLFVHETKTCSISVIISPYRYKNRSFFSDSQHSAPASSQQHLLHDKVLILPPSQPFLINHLCHVLLSLSWPRERTRQVALYMKFALRPTSDTLPSHSRRTTSTHVTFVTQIINYFLGLSSHWTLSSLSIPSAVMHDFRHCTTFTNHISSTMHFTIPWDLS